MHTSDDRRSRRWAVMFVAGTLLAVPACGSDSESSPASTTLPGPEPGSSADLTTTTAAPPADGSCDTAGDTSSKSQAFSAGVSYLTDVSVEPQGCVVRFTFRDDPGLPGYSIGYEDGPFTFGEDRTLEIDGSAFLVVHFEQASAVEFGDEDLTETYTGPDELRPEGVPHLLEIAELTDFEGVLTWVMGLDDERPFNVAVDGAVVEIILG